MKNFYSIITCAFFVFCTFLPQNAISQSPQKMSYQSSIRNATNDLVAESVVGVQISILQGTPAGTAVYVERHTPMTNINGLVSLEIGMGTTLSGTFASVDWSAGPYYLRTDTDPLGGTTYILTGTTELLSVPYALYAANSGSWTVTDDVVHTDMAVGIGTETPNGHLHVVDDVGTYSTAIFGESTFEGFADLYGVRGRSINAPGYGFGGYFEGGYRGLFAHANSTDYTGSTLGIYGRATGSAGSRTGVYAEAANSGGSAAYGVQGIGSGATTNFGVFGSSSGGTTNWAGYFSGNVRVTGAGGTPATEASDAQLHVLENVGTHTSTIYGESTYEEFSDRYGVRGRSVNAPGYGYGGFFEGGWRGIYALASSTTYTGTANGVYGIANGSAGSRRGVFGSASNFGGNTAYGVYGSGNSATTNYGVYGTATGGTTNWAGYFAGDVRITGTLDNTSDAKLKKDIKDMENALDIIKRLEPKTYAFRTDEFPQMALDKRPQLGFIAQDMEKVLPQLVRTAIHPGFQKEGREESDIPNSADVDVMSINYIGIIPVLTQGIKELAIEVEAKDAVIEELIIRMEQIEKELQSLRK